MTGKMIDMLTIERRDRLNGIDRMISWAADWGTRNMTITKIYLDTYYPEDEELMTFNQLALLSMKNGEV